MTGGGDLDEIQQTTPEDTFDELGGTGEGEADAPVGYEVDVNENDSDPTAGASDVGGLAGGIDEDNGASGGSSRR